MNPQNTEKRFWQKVDFVEDEHWLWKGKPTKEHRNTFNFLGKIWRVHKLAWFFQKKEIIPKRKILINNCGNSKCINPAHMFVIERPQFIKLYSPQFKNENKGEQNPNCKLTKEQVLKIRADTKHKNIDIAKRYNVSPSLISNIKNNRRNWVWLTQKNYE